MNDAPFMHTLALPRTDLRVSSLCLGTANFGASVSDDESFALLDQFLEAGGNFLDTAAIYADWTSAGKGSSEKLLAKWLHARGVRDKVVLATKGGHPELASMGMARLSRREVEADLNTSLNNLVCETIDLYYLHRDDPGRPVEEILNYLEEFVSDGKIRYYACSNWKLPRIEKAWEAAQALGAKGFVASQPLWNLAEVDLTGGDQTLAPMTPELRAWHQQHDFPAIAYSSQANGYFNKVAEGRESDIGSLTSMMYDSESVRAINRARLRRLETIAEETGHNITQLVLGYLLSQPFPAVPIVGCRTTAQLADSLTGADVKLATEHLEALMAPIE